MNLGEAIKLANKQDNDKTPYTFRCNTKTLEQLKQYSTINNVRLPSLLNVILSDWCNKHIKGNITETEYISADILDRIKFLEKNAICIYNDLGVLPFTSASSLCDLLNDFYEENQLLKEEKELLKNKLDRIEDILPHFLSCAEICDFRSKTFKEDIALRKCWNKRHQND